MLSLRNVKKSYTEPDGNRLPILDIAQFDVANGEQIVLVGRSGCGKTTLLHTICGITRADAGQIIIDGIDIAQRSGARRRSGPGRPASAMSFRRSICSPASRPWKTSCWE